MNLLPAVVIGGPPHSGKSVLTWALAQALRRRNVQHYVLRAAPDGEGLWSQESDPGTVQLIRHKGAFSPEFNVHVRLSIRGRHLPLIVDVGGRPQHEQLKIMGECTHTLLLYKTEDDLHEWRDYFARYNLITVAEIQSDYIGSDRILESLPVLTATLAKLERWTDKSGSVIEALAERLSGIFDYPPEELTAQHLAHSPVPDPVVLLDAAMQLGFAPRGAAHHHWQPEQLPSLLEIREAHAPIAIYGRGPNWVYGALAGHASPSTCHLFDVRLGWVKAEQLRIASELSTEFLNFQTQVTLKFSFLNMTINKSFLDYLDLRDMTLPNVQTDRGLVISGQLPHWLWTSLVRSYRSRCKWIALYQPLLKDRAIVCVSDMDDVSIGSLIDISASLRVTQSQDS